MSNERPDNEIKWGKKLEEPDGVPPEPWVGKDAAWEKLYSRLHEKPRRKLPFWYWAAAACLAGVLYLAVRPSVKDNRSGTVIASSGKRDTGVAGQTVIMNKRPASPKPKFQRTLKINEKPVLPLTEQPVAVTGSANTTTTATDTTTALLKGSTFPAVDTFALARLKVPPAWKKLRVVSINELSDPAAEATILAANTGASEKNNKHYKGYVRSYTGYAGAPFFRFFPARNPVIPITTALADNPDHQLLKIKLSPKN